MKEARQKNIYDTVSIKILENANQIYGDKKQACSCLGLAVEGSTDCKGLRGTLRDDGNVLELECSGEVTGEVIYQNSLNCTI